MVKQMKLSFASLLGAVALMAGCTDDDLVKPIVRGEGVQFGASASFEAGNDNRGSRTEYGQVIGNKIQLNWVPNVDIIDIAYPEAAQSKLVAYDVLDEQHTTNPSQSVATTLGVHKGQSGGLQWGTPGTDGKHHFYAVYPSRKMFAENEQDRIVMDSEGFTGYMPNAQDPKEKTGNATQGYVLQPDMRYAYMVAKTEHADDAGAQVSLDFHPLVTALEFSITADHVVGENNIPDTGITLQGIQLSSVGGNEPNSVVSNICGSFNYKFKTDVVTDANPASSTEFDQIYMNVPDGALMKKGTKLDFTFFVIPTKNFAAKELKLTFVYLDTHGVLTNKTASIGRGIEMKKKYFFKNITFPAINADPSPSMWFSMLDNDIYLNQLSIPVAGNAFTNNYTDTDAKYHKQQVTDYLSLWNQGVRGFELVTDWATDFGSQHFVGGEKILTTSPTFDTAVKSLLAFMAGEKTKNECLFLICHYHPVSAKMNPQSYITNLIAYFDGLIGQNVTSGTSTHTIAADDFVLLTDGMTTKDVRGKVCIIIRPGDDDYMKMARLDNTSCPASSDDLKLSGTLGPKMLLIKNWGSAYDRWDKRYTGAVREATWADRVDANGTGTRIEELLTGISKSKSSFTPGVAFSTAAWPAPVSGDSRYTQATKNTQATNAGTAYVHEWCRVVPNGGIYDYSGEWYDAVFPKNVRFLWVKWPSSITEKKDDIDAVFKKSILGNNLCINVLSGYYITKQHTKSLVPFKESWTTDYGGQKITPEGQGNGGNFAGLAADLNTYVYDKLTSDAYGVGPLGLVQIDFIGATEKNFDDYDTDDYNTDHAKAAVASQNLVSFIAMNNFRFPMTRKPGTFSAPEVNDASLDENIAIQ